MLVELLAELCLGLGLNPREAIRGHDELQGGSSDGSKRCPGDLLDMDKLRVDARSFLVERRLRSLERVAVAV